MSKMSALEIFNEVLRNCGESTVSGLSSLSGFQLLVWNKIIEALQDICTDEDTRLSFLESDGAVPMVTDSYKYEIAALASGGDMLTEDRESLRCADNSSKVKYLTPQEFDDKYPGGITAQRTGYPSEYTKYGGYFVFNNQATTGQNGQNVSFRYWKRPTLYSTATSTMTGDLPAPFDRTLLVPLATLKAMTYLGNDEAAVYKVQVFGNGSDIEGSMDKLKRIHSSPVLKPRVTYHF